MKNKLFNGIAGIFVTWSLTLVATAQISNGIAQLRSEPSPEKSIPESKKLDLKKSDSGFIYRNEINTKAVRNFIRDFKNVSNAVWYKSANGLTVAYFATDKIRTWVFYNDNGDHEYTLRHYGEGELPSDVRHTVKSKYYDFSIYHVSEITRNEKIAYTIHLEDKKSWKTVRVMDGELELIQELNKSQIKRIN